MTDEHTPTDDDMRAFYAEYAEEVFRSWNPGQPVPTREEFLAPFERWLTATKNEPLDAAITEMQRVQMQTRPGAPYHQGMWDGMDMAERIVAEKRVQGG